MTENIIAVYVTLLTDFLVNTNAKASSLSGVSMFPQFCTVSGTLSTVHDTNKSVFIFARMIPFKAPNRFQYEFCSEDPPGSRSRYR